MIEAGEVITATGLTASVLAPVCMAYCIISLRRDVAHGGRVKLVLGGLAIIQSVAALIYFAMLWHVMSRTGLGV